LCLLFLINPLWSFPTLPHLCILPLQVIRFYLLCLENKYINKQKTKNVNSVWIFTSSSSTNYYIEFDKIAPVWTPFLMESQLRSKEQTIRKSFLVYANFHLLRLALKRGILNILLSHIFWQVLRRILLNLLETIYWAIK